MSANPSTDRGSRLEVPAQAEGSLPSFSGNIPVSALMSGIERRDYLRDLLREASLSYRRAAESVEIKLDLNPAELITVQQLAAKESVYLDNPGSGILQINGPTQIMRAIRLKLLTPDIMSAAKPSVAPKPFSGDPSDLEYDTLMEMYNSDKYSSVSGVIKAYRSMHPDSNVSTTDLNHWARGSQLPPEVQKRNEILGAQSSAREVNLNQVFIDRVSQYRGSAALTAACTLATEMIGNPTLTSYATGIRRERIVELVNGGVAPTLNEYQRILHGASITPEKRLTELWHRSHTVVAPQNSDQLLELIPQKAHPLARHYIGSLMRLAKDTAARGEDVKEAVRERMKYLNKRAGNLQRYKY